jgi:hypothetical protein
LDQVAEAEQAFRQSLLLSPGYAPSRFALGFLLWQRDGPHPEARELMKSSAAMVPGAKELMKKIGAK